MHTYPKIPIWNHFCLGNGVIHAQKMKNVILTEVSLRSHFIHRSHFFAAPVKWKSCTSVSRHFTLNSMSCLKCRLCTHLAHTKPIHSACSKISRVRTEHEQDFLNKIVFHVCRFHNYTAPECYWKWIPIFPYALLFASIIVAKNCWGVPQNKSILYLPTA